MTKIISTHRAILGLGLLVLGTAGAFAAPAKYHWKGTIPVTGKPSDAELAKMAKITEAAAGKSALAAIKAKADAKSVSATELEAENGYLIYSVEVKVKGKSGIDEVTVDAGNGKALRVEHESPASEATEAASEKKEAGEKDEADEKGEKSEKGEKGEKAEKGEEKD